jgi:hypothetical protein
MPFIKLNNDWSNLASYYNTLNNNGSFVGGSTNPNVTNSQKPQIPKQSEQFKLFDDGLIRGGVLNAALATKKDVLNIGKFLYTSVKGPLFIIKQIGLHLSNPLLEQKANRTVTTDAAGNTVTTYTRRKDKLGLLPTRIYNGGINTLLSVGGNAFGIHFPGFGLLPTADYNYAKIAKENSDNSKDDSTSSVFLPPNLNLTPYNNVKELDEVVVTGNRKKNSKKLPSPYTDKPNRLVSYLGKLIENGSSTNPITLQSYLGGPDSVYGLVNTRIRTTGDSITNKDNTLLNGFIPLSYRSIYNIGNELKSISNRESYINYYYGPGLKQTVTSQFTATGETTQQQIDAGVKAEFIDVPVVNETKVTTVNQVSGKTYIPLEYTYGVSHTGKRGANYQYSVDSINAIKITDSKTFYSNVTKKASETLGSYSNTNIEQTSIFGKDIIKFRIEILNNNQPVLGGVTNTEVYAFRAYINELNDGIDAKWEPYRYMGRGEEFYIYNGFTRDISVGFTVFAHSKPEMKIIYQKVNNLMSSFTPDYSRAGLMRGNIGYLTVGDYLYRVPGVFTSMKVGNLLDAHWETNIDGDTYELPKLMNITLSFKPIHSFVPKRNYADKETAAFITPDISTYIDTGVADIKSKTTGDKPTTTYANRFMPSIDKTVNTQ